MKASTNYRTLALLVAGLIPMGCDSGGTGTSLSDDTSTSGTTGSTPGGVSTADVGCTYSYSAFNSSPSVNATSTADWVCDSTTRWLSANGVPDHDVGTFPNSANPSAISVQAVTASFSLTPTEAGSATTLGGPQGAVGYVMNGVKIDPATAGTCNDAGDNCSLAGSSVGSWRIEALGQSSFDFGEDANNAHVQPTGAYHYHGIPEAFVEAQDKGTEMTLIGWAADGFPIYARYGYFDPMDASSGTVIIQASYRLKSSPDANRPDVSLYAMGTFSADYEYVAGYGDLDECNGRTGVTPEFPDGIYHYYATDTYPFLQRCIMGVR